MAKPRDAPKYWDDSYETVVAGVEMRDTPTRLADILGTYVWLFSGDPEWGGDVEDMHRSDYKDDAAFIARHSIMLGAAKHRPGQSVAPEDVSGHIALGGKSSNAAVVESYWEVLLNEEQDDEDSATWLDTEGNAVGVSVVLDDNGSPFLVFEWHLQGGGHSSWSGYYLGKRLVKGEGGEEDYYGRSDEDETSGGRDQEEERRAVIERGAKKRKVSSDERGSTSKKRKASSDEKGSTSKKRKASSDREGSTSKKMESEQR
ncbi:hypothetical protein F5887DRAFT_1005244 [Amanita rubescens]|nr:hypothetical protein F5887DRAFT_1005244 [Amanita rubescens]